MVNRIKRDGTSQLHIKVEMKKAVEGKKNGYKNNVRDECSQGFLLLQPFIGSRFRVQRLCPRGQSPSVASRVHRKRACRSEA